MGFKKQGNTPSHAENSVQTRCICGTWVADGTRQSSKMTTDV